MFFSPINPSRPRGLFGRNLALGALLLALGGLFLALGAAPLSAQGGVLVVQVRGPGGPVVGATVDLIFAGDVLRSEGTDGQGNVLFAGIPGGTFTVRVEALGFETRVNEAVRVDPGVSQALEMVLELAPIEVEGLTIRTDRIQIQRENTEFSTSVQESAILLLPVTYNARDLVALTPGARPGHIWGGANFQANSYTLDGLSSNHPGVGGELLQPSIHWIEQIHVRGLGAGAEYGGFQGGLVDVVTKSGSNDFQGNIRSTFEHDLANGSNLVKTEVGREVLDRLDIEGEARGPLIHDQLFYYVSGKFVNQAQQALNHLNDYEGRFTPIREIGQEYKGFGKLTWTPTSTRLLEVSGGYTDHRVDNFEITGYESHGATHRYTSPTFFINASARELLGSWAVVEARVNHLNRDERFDPYNGTDTPGISTYTLTPPYSSFQNHPLSLRSAPTSTSATAMATLNFQSGSLTHSLKVGGEVTRGTFLDQRHRNGGMTWLPVNTDHFDPEDPTTWYERVQAGIPTLWGGEVNLDADVLSTAFFAQSSIAVGPWATVTPGLRWAQWKGYLDPVSGDRFKAVQASGLDPRVGLTVKLTRDGSLVAKAHWGRYHQNMITQMFDRVAGGDVFTNQEYWFYRGGPFSDPTRTITVDEREGFEESGDLVKGGEIVLTETGTVQDYKQPYVDQWLIGLEKQFSDWGKAELLYTRRVNKDMVALVDVNRDTNYTLFERVRVFDPGGSVVPFSGGSVYLQELYVPNNTILERLRCRAQGTCPEAADIPGLTAADTVGLSWNPQYVLTTAPDAKREFGQLQVNLEVSRPNWGGSVSVVMTDLEGNLDNVSGYTDPEGYGSGPYVRVNEAVNYYGTLENFADVEFKLSAWGSLPWQMRGGLFATLRSGDHYSPQFRLYGLGFFSYRLNTGALTSTGAPERVGEELDYRLLVPLEGHDLYLGPRGAPTLERQSVVDLRLERLFRLRGYTLSVSLDVFNLLRNEAITELNTMVNNGPNYGFIQDPNSDIPAIEPNLYYKAPQQRTNPRTMRIGVAMYF